MVETIRDPAPDPHFERSLRMIAAFMDAELPDSRRDELIGLLLASPDLYATLVLALRVRGDLGPDPADTDPP